MRKDWAKARRFSEIFPKGGAEEIMGERGGAEEIMGERGGAEQSEDASVEEVFLYDFFNLIRSQWVFGGLICRNQMDGRKEAMGSV